MPIVDYKRYCAMLDKAKAGKYAYPAFNCTSNETINAAIEGLAEAKSDGMIQFSTGAGEFATGNLKDALIHFYNVLDQYEPDENAAVSPAALLGVVQVQIRSGEKDKAKKTSADLVKKYPRSKEAAESQKLVKN